MIPDKTIRVEKWTGSRFGLEQTLNELPLTQKDRAKINFYINNMEEAFVEANNQGE